MLRNLLSLVMVLQAQYLATRVHNSKYERAPCVGEHSLIVFNENSINSDDLSNIVPRFTPPPVVRGVKEAKQTQLITDGELNYPVVVILSAKLPFRPSHVLEYLEAGGSLLWALDDPVDKAEESLLKHFGLRTVGNVVDQIHSYGDGIISSSNFSSDHAFYTLIKSSKVKWRGTGFEVIPIGEKSGHNDLIRPVLLAEESAKTETIVGDNIVLAASLDSRNEGRIFIVGSTFAFKSLSENNAFVNIAVDWIQKKIAVTKLDSFSHYQGGHENSDAYVVKTEFEVVACLSQLDEKSKDLPFLPRDLQVELVMQHPRERITLVPNDQDKCLHGIFKVPDIYGRYSLRLEYNKPGYPLISATKMISVRPPWLDQVPRFAFVAIPYYVGWQAQLLVTCLFLIPLLWSRVDCGVGKEILQ